MIGINTIPMLLVELGRPVNISRTELVPKYEIKIALTKDAKIWGILAGNLSGIILIFLPIIRMAPSTLVQVRASDNVTSSSLFLQVSFSFVVTLFAGCTLSYIVGNVPK